VHYAEDGNVYDAAESLGVPVSEILDFSSNVSPAPAAAVVGEAFGLDMSSVSRYPDPDARELRAKAAEHFGVTAEHVLVGSGATEFIYAIPRRIRPRRVAIFAPCYHDYWRATEHAGGEAEGILASESDEFVPDLSTVEPRLGGVGMVFIGNPNNPTGVALPADAIRLLASKCPSTVFVVDEAYGGFVPDAAGATMLGKPIPGNVIVLRSLSSFAAVPGLRIGFMICHPDLCQQIRRVREPWTVSAVSQAAGMAIMSHSDYCANIREETIGERERLRDELGRMPGLRVFHSQSNFLLAKVTRPTLMSTHLCERMVQQKILLRNAAGFRGLDGKFVRITVRSASENDRLLEAMRKALDEKQWAGATG
jgi:L-threonine-O-3-phosphate decarboxylase